MADIKADIYDTTLFNLKIVVVVYIYLMPCKHLRLFSWQKQLKYTSITNTI